MAIKIEEQLWVNARYLATESGMDFTVPCSTIIRDFIQAGAKNMLRENRQTELDFEEAESNLILFVHKMVEVTRKLTNPRATLPGPILIRETAFVKAKEICPLWPYC